MAVDTKPNLNSGKFEQCVGDVLLLSGCTEVFGEYVLQSGSTLSILGDRGVGKVLTSDDNGVATWQIVPQTITGASNGLSVTGQNIELGGCLYKNTAIDLCGYTYCIDGAPGAEFISIVDSTCVATFGSQCVASTNILRGPSSCMSMAYDCVLFCDTSVSPKGIEYNGDYSASFTNRSLVDKGYVDNAIATGGTASGENISKLVNQPSHGFTVGDVLGWSSGAYSLPTADGTYDGEVLGIVSKCYNTDCFDLTQAGYVTGLTGLVANTTYFLSPTTAGLLTDVEPSGDTQISKAVLIATASDTAWVLPYPGYVITTGSTGGGITSAANGLSTDGTTVCLGGILTGYTEINTGGNDLYVCLSGSGIFGATGAQADIHVDNGSNSAYLESLGGSICAAPTFIEIIGAGTNCLTFTSAATTYTNGDGAGITYAADYSINYTDRSLVDKEYVDTHFGSGTITGGTNGLSTSGSNIILGGILTGPTVITGNSQVFCLGSLGNPLATIDIRANNMTMCGSGGLNLNGGASAYINGGNILFQLDTTGGVITDNSGYNRGLRYAADYSASFDNESLITKRYVTGLTSQLTNYWSSGTTGLYPKKSNNIVLDSNKSICWSGSSVCICGSATGTDTLVLSANGFTSFLVLCADDTIGLQATSSFVVDTPSMVLRSPVNSCQFRVEPGSQRIYAYPQGMPLTICTVNADDTVDAGTLTLGGGVSANVGYTTAGGHVRVCAGSSCCGTGGTMCIVAGRQICTGTYSPICVVGLPAKTTETCGIYINANGKLSVGCISGGTSPSGGGIGWSNSDNGSTVAGCDTPASAATICNNTLYGVSAGLNLTSGQCNIAIGRSALSNTQSSNDNIAIGQNAQGLTTTGGCNIAIGTRALGSNRPGASNIAIGFESLYSNCCGIQNVAIGCQTLASNISGCTNIGIGRQALYYNTFGCDNIALGTYALYYNTIGKYNIAIGTCSLYCLSATTTNGNIAIGEHAQFSSWRGKCNIAIGGYAGYSNRCACDNIAIGDGALYTNCGIAGYGQNIAIGSCAFCSNATAYRNIAIGHQAMNAGNASFYGAVAIGYRALYNNAGYNNIGIGYDTAYNITSGQGNVALGTCTLYCATTLSNSVAIGGGAGCGLKVGNQNIAIGSNAMYGATGGTSNIGIGENTMITMQSSAYYNIALGPGAMQSLKTGQHNVGMGYAVLSTVAGGCCNIAFGWNALSNVSGGSCNVAIGVDAGCLSCGKAGGVFLGHRAGATELGANKLHIANNSSCSLICGNFTGKTVCIDNCLYVNSITCPSDCRLKSNISSISIAPVVAEYKQFNHCDTPNKLSVGIIAQDLCLTHPNLVSVDDKGFLGVDYGELHSLEIAYLKCKVSELEKKINELIQK